MSSNEGSVEKTRVFTSTELEIATDHYNENRILGRGGQGEFDGELVEEESKVIREEARDGDGKGLDGRLDSVSMGEGFGGKDNGKSVSFSYVEMVVVKRGSCDFSKV
ncbi:hypothetical protein QYF36_023693 [Acer negundo]|nr:hypothetical protein QYF36_023693 [Acer negundo]